MSERYYSSTLITSDRTTLDGPEAHHLAHVMRMAVGQRVVLFDGSGAEFEAAVEAVGRSSVDLRIIERRDVDRELPFPLVAGVALPKGDRQKWLVEKLTELGVTALVPLVTERGVAQPGDGTLERLRRAVIEASKQCGRNRLMRIATPQSWGDFVKVWLGSSDCDNHHESTGGRSSALTDEPPAECRLVAHPGGFPLARFDLKLPKPNRIAVGPEGGFTDAEIAAAIAAGWLAINLGPRTLRVETAAIALAAFAIQYGGSSQRP
jgi:16S rRNA (uracil1498-N3)-methyltransferase